MADPKTNLRVRILADLVDFQRGIGSMRKSLTGLGGLLTASVAGLSVIGVVGSVIKATAEAEQAMAQLEARLKSTKGAAGLTKDELVDMAGGLQQVTTYGDEAIIGAQSMLLTFTRIGRDVFPFATEAVLNMATAMGTDLNSAAVQIGKALNDPVKGVTALGRAGVQFTEQQQAAIKALTESGDLLTAQKIILQELETQFGGAARAARNTLGGAFTALKEAAGDLLEGDSGTGGVRGVRKSIDDLTALLQSPSTQQAFASITEAVFNLASAFVSVATEARNAWQDAQRWLTLKIGGTKQITDLQQIRYEIGKMQEVVDEFEASGPVKQFLARPDLEAAKNRLAELKRLEKQSLLIFGDPDEAPTRHSTETEQRGLSVDPGVVERAAQEEKARERAEKLRKEHERLRKEADRAEKARQAELKALRERVEQGLREVEIALDRAAGNEAEAAFKEIDDRWKQLITDLKASGNKEGEALVDRLIDVEKADARLQDLKRRFDKTMGEFQLREQQIFDSLSTGEVSLSAGVAMGDVDAEIQLKDLRASSLQQLQELRASVADYYAETMNPQVLTYLQQLDQAIAQVKVSQHQLAVATAEVGTGALTTFFTDLATSAKSFKDAFKDLVRNFVAGMAQIAARALATFLVLQLLDAIYPGLGKATAASMQAGVFHGGGVAGQGGTVRSGINPLLFGAAPRYHSGGVAGLAPDEVPAILQRGETIRTKQQEAALQAQLGGGVGGADRTNVVVVFGEDELANALSGVAGEKVVVAHARNNRGAING